MTRSLAIVVVVLVGFVLGFTLLARAAAHEARTQVCYLTCTP